jgi:hypothetical protein
MMLKTRAVMMLRPSRHEKDGKVMMNTDLPEVDWNLSVYVAVVAVVAVVVQKNCIDDNVVVRWMM